MLSTCCFLCYIVCVLQDSRTPAFAVVLSVAVNIISNLVAVAWLGLGLQGAAATTVATQVMIQGIVVKGIHAHAD